MGDVKDKILRPVPFLYVGDVTISQSKTETNNVVITGNLVVNAGTYTVNGDLEVRGTMNLTGATALTVKGSLKVRDTITSTTAVVTVGVDLHCGNGFNITTGALTVRGRGFISGDNLNRTGAGTSTFGSLFAWVGVRFDAANATLTVKGSAFIRELNYNANAAIATIDGPLEVVTSVTVGSGQLSAGSLKAHGSITNTSGTITIGGDAFIGAALSTTTGAVTITGNCYVRSGVTLSDTGDMIVWGNLRCDSVAISNAGAVLTVEGNLEVLNTGNSVNMTAAGQVIIKKDLFCAGTYVNFTATLAVYGNLVALSLTTTSGGITVRGNFYLASDYVQSGTGDLVVYGDLSVSNITLNVSGGNVDIARNAHIGSTLLVNAVSDIQIHGNLFISYITLGAGFLLIGHSCYCEGSISATTGDMYVYNNLQVQGTTTISGAAGLLYVYGDAILTGATGATNATAVITIDGIARIYGTITATGTVTYKGVYPEVAVNINAILASETDFLNLALTAGFHWDIKDLVLKAADPGANTIAVRLYQLVNGALTNTHTFTIATAGALVRGTSGGFALYFSLDDMFTRQQLADDNVKITVQASAGGPYAVTGAYKYSSGSMP